MESEADWGPFVLSLMVGARAGRCVAVSPNPTPLPPLLSGLTQQEGFSAQT